MLSEDDEKELLALLENRKKYKIFFEVLKKKHVSIPMILLFLYLIDNPDIHILKWLISMFKKLIYLT